MKSPPRPPTTSSGRAFLVQRHEGQSGAAFIDACGRVGDGQGEPGMPSPGHVDARVGDGGQTDAVDLLDHAVRVGAGVHAHPARAPGRRARRPENVDVVRRAEHGEAVQRRRGFEAEHVVGGVQQMRPNAREVLLPRRERLPRVTRRIDTPCHLDDLATAHAPRGVRHRGGGHQREGRVDRSSEHRHRSTVPSAIARVRRHPSIRGQLPPATVGGGAATPAPRRHPADNSVAGCRRVVSRVQSRGPRRPTLHAGGGPRRPAPRARRPGDRSGGVG